VTNIYINMDSPQILYCYPLSSLVFDHYKSQIL